jgi:hypothetical protein
MKKLLIILLILLVPTVNAVDFITEDIEVTFTLSPPDIIYEDFEVTFTLSMPDLIYEDFEVVFTLISGNITSYFEYVLYEENQTVIFTDASETTDVNITFWNWQLGDGSHRYTQNVTRTYGFDWNETEEDEIIYTVCLTVENETTGLKSTRCRDIQFNREVPDEGAMFELPTELFLALMAVIIFIVLTYTVINIMEGTLNKSFRRK